MAHLLFRAGAASAGVVIITRAGTTGLAVEADWLVVEGGAWVVAGAEVEVTGAAVVVVVVLVVVVVVVGAAVVELARALSGLLMISSARASGANCKNTFTATFSVVFGGVALVDGALVVLAAVVGAA